MLNKTTTLVLLVSLAAAQGIFASDTKEDMSSNFPSSPRASSSATPVEGNESPVASFPATSDIFAALEEVDIDDLGREIGINFEDLKDLDLNGNQYLSEKVKAYVSKKPGGETIVRLAGLVAKKAFGTDTLTEGVLKVARTPLKIDPENYPTTVEELIGQKAKNLVDAIPGGKKVTTITGVIAQTLFGKKTLTEVIAGKIMSSKKKNPKDETSEDEAEKEVKTSSAELKNSNEE